MRGKQALKERAPKKRGREGSKRSKHPPRELCQAGVALMWKKRQKEGQKNTGRVRQVVWKRKTKACLFLIDIGEGEMG